MPDPAGHPKPAISRGEWGILLLLAAIQFTNVLDFVIVMPLVPSIEKHYQVDTGPVGYAVGIYGVASAVSSLAAVRFLDRFGRKTVLLAMYLGFTVATLLCGLAPTFETLVAARGLAGAFGGVLGAAVMAVIGDVFADYRRGTAMGVVMSAFAVSSVVGIPAGLGLAQVWGIGAPFVALSVLCAAVWVGVARVFPTIPPHPERRPVALTTLLANPAHRLALAFTAALVAGSFTVVPFLAAAMVHNAGQKEENLFLLYAVAGGVTFFTTNLAGRVADRYGKLRVFRVTGACTIGVLILITNLPPVSLWVAVVVTTAFMVASSARMVPAQALITGSSAPAVRGGFLSLNTAVQSVAMGVSSFVGGKLIDQQPDGRLAGWPVVGLVAAATALVSLILAGWLRLVDVGPTRIPAPEPVETAA